MSTSRHLSSISAGPDAAASNSATALRREVALAVIVGALLLGGVAVGGSLADGQEPLLSQQADVSEAQPPLEFDYFPSHYVNQGVESSDEIPTF